MYGVGDLKICYPFPRVPRNIFQLVFDQSSLQNIHSFGDIVMHCSALHCFMR